LLDSSPDSTDPNYLLESLLLSPILSNFGAEYVPNTLKKAVAHGETGLSIRSTVSPSDGACTMLHSACTNNAVSKFGTSPLFKLPDKTVADVG
jgi:hypothetical protein